MLKLKENQGFSSFDFFITTASIAVIFAVSTPILKKNMEVGNIDRAQREARNLAFELLHDDKFQKLRLGSYKVQNSNQGRAIASVPKDDSWSGELGKDPWGQPYKFRFLRNKEGMPVEIAVWSQGPDTKLDSSKFEAKVSRVGDVEQIELHPDFVVTQVPLR